MTTTEKLPIGIENFKDIRRLGFYYIDKTGLIKELLNNWAKVNLFTRPRRFGKTLNMSMLQSFFEFDCDKSLFAGLDIEKEKELCDKFMGQFPVIFISLKGVEGDSFETSRSMMRAEIQREAMRFQFLLESDKLTALDKKLYLRLAEDGPHDGAMQDAVLMNGLLNLSILLHKHYGQKVIVLIDEYDVPLDKAYAHGYYDKMAALLRNVFGQVLKTNESLYFAVLTGCLRVSKESIFTGLNNFKVLSVTDVQYDEYFGFTDMEVVQMLKAYRREDSYEMTKKWYDGYRFGNVDVYCPWDVISHCDALRLNPDAEPRPYWPNTSSNSIVKRFIQKSTKRTQRELEQLVAGETIRKKIRQDLTYNELDTTIDNLWSVLFTTGYLTQRGKSEGNVYELAIPNLEIGDIFVTQINEWFQDIALLDKPKLNAFCLAFKRGDAEGIEEQFNSYLMRTIRVRDAGARKHRKESFYHGILLGLLSYEETWFAFSNAETGEEYRDILIEIEDEKIGIVIEIKYAENDNLEASCADALGQIDKMKYVERLRADGMKKIMKYGIACCKKHCKVVFE